MKKIKENPSQDGWSFRQRLVEEFAETSRCCGARVVVVPAGSEVEMCSECGGLNPAPGSFGLSEFSSFFYPRA